jgi:hypothetical protein
MVQCRRRGGVRGTHAIACALVLVVVGCGGTNPSHERSFTHVLSSAGVSLRIPRTWYGKEMTLPEGKALRTAWLQATNFPARSLVRGEDPLKAMSAAGVVITVSEDLGASENASTSVSLTPTDLVPPSQTPRGYSALQKSVLVNGRRLIISVDFGSPSAARRLLPTVNSILATLRARRT